MSINGKTLLTILLAVYLLPGCQGRLRLTPLTVDSQNLPLTPSPLPAKALALMAHQDNLLLLTPQTLITMARSREEEAEAAFSITRQHTLTEEPAFLLRTLSGAPHALVYSSGALSLLSSEKLLPTPAIPGIPHARYGFATPQGTFLFSDKAWCRVEKQVPQQKVHPLPSPYLGVARIGNEEMAVLCQNHMLLWTGTVSGPRVVSLPEKATSPPCFWKGSLYFGVAPRHLIRWDLHSEKPKWKIKLSRRLIFPPLGFPQGLLVMPQDQGLFWYLASGTLKWWTPAQGQAQWAPLVYKDCALVVLKPTGTENRMLIADPVRQVVDWIPLPAPLQALPCLSQGELILPGAPPSGLTRLVNLRTVRVKSDPADIILPRRTLKLFFKPVNLEDPQLEISIINPDTQTPLRQTIPRGKAQELVWIPENPGTYTLVIHAIPRRGDPVDVTFPLKVQDLSQLLLDRLKEQRDTTTQEVLP